MPAPEGIQRIGDGTWELPPTLRPGMRVPVRVFATEDLLRAWTAPTLLPVINATGVVLHTNLGRAPLAARSVSHAARPVRASLQD